MKKKVETNSKKRMFWAFVLSFLILYGGTMLVVIGSTFLRLYLDQTIYESAWTKLLYAKSFNGVPMHMIQQAVASIATGGVISGISYVLVFLLFFFSGWVLVKVARSFPWFFSALPVLFISLFSFHLISSGGYSSLGYPITLFYFADGMKYYLIGLFIFAALLGGFSQKHLSIRWNK